MKKLFKYDSKGNIQEWRIIVKENSYWTEEGIKGGKITKSLPTVCKGKNIGRSNETTPSEQAKKEALSKWKKKIENGYNEKLSKEKSFAVMLAHNYNDYKDSLDFSKGIYIQPKLDGLRCNNRNNILLSRNNKEFHSVPHLKQDKYHLDGELYNHDYKDDFDSIISLTRKKNVTDKDLDESKDKIYMHVYDFPQYSHLPFSERFEKLKKILPELGESFVLVPTYKVSSYEELDELHGKFLEEGYEGSIIRTDNVYENKRSKFLLKRKEFIDSEFIIKGYVEGIGNRTGTIGKFILKMDDGSDETFKCNVKGSFEKLREIWKDVDSYVGKTATVKYFKRTPNNVPKWGYIIKIAREDFE